MPSFLYVYNLWKTITVKNKNKKLLKLITCFRPPLNGCFCLKLGKKWYCYSGGVALFIYIVYNINIKLR